MVVLKQSVSKGLIFQKNLFCLCSIVCYFVICPVPGCGTMVEGCPLGSCIASTLTLEIVVPIIHATLRSLRQWLAFLSRNAPCNETLHFLHLFITPLLFVPYHVLYFHSSAVSFIKRIGFNCNTESPTLTNRPWRCSDYKIIPKQVDSCWGFP